jgi:PAS domain S-box-containing protein
MKAQEIPTQGSAPCSSEGTGRCVQGTEGHSFAGTGITADRPGDEGYGTHTATTPQSNRSKVVAGLTFRASAATLVVMAAILLGHAVPGPAGLDLPFILFLAALLLAAWHLGTGLSVVAVFGGPILAGVFLTVIEGASSPFGTAQVEATLGYFLIGIVATMLIHAFRRSHRRALDKAVQSREKVELLEREFQEQERAVSELREHDERLRLFFENVRGVAMFSLDQEGRVSDWNPAAESVCGLAKEEVLGRHLSHVLAGKEDVELARNILTQARQKCCAVHKGWHRRGSGDIYLHSVTCAKYNKAGRLIGYLMIALDLTEQAGAQEALRLSEERFRNLFEFAAVGIAQLDLEGRFLDVNGRFCEIIGYSLEELRQLTFLDITLPEDRELDRIGFERIRTGEMPFLQREKRYLHKDGRILWSRVTASFLRDAEGNPQRTVSVIEEITARKEAEAALESARNQLAGQAKSLEGIVAERTEKLRHSLEDMEEFCSSIAHHFRAPLRAMSGFSQTLLADHAPCLDETAAGYCRRIDAAATRMDRLIFDLLSYERLAYLNLTVHPVKPAEEIEKVLGILADEVQTRQAAIEVERPFPKVCADIPVLDQIFQHLLENALKFVPPERVPRLRIHAERRSGYVRLWFEDNGIGIPPEYHDRIFGVFERLPSAHAGGLAGTGIGLAVVRRGVEMMGGHSGVESQKQEQGSRFWIELPEPAL